MLGAGMPISALAAMIILALNPAALCTASSQLSFPAMAALVLLYKARTRQANSESADGRECKPLARPLRHVAALLVTLMIKGVATLKFATQHFGMVTIWGVMLMVAALVMWALTPAPDEALLARSRTPILVLSFAAPRCVC